MSAAIDRLRAELGWAWRGIRTRGWRGAVAVALVAVEFSANALLFAVADSVVSG